MAKPKPGMGRGLSAILSVSEEPTPGERDLREVAVDLIMPGESQPRRRFDADSLAALAASLRERGVLQPVLVRPRPAGTYELIAGERRWRAAKIAGLQTIPAIVRTQDDAAALELALIENMAREDLSPVEEARACAALVEELGLTREDVGRRVGRGRVAVSNLIRLLDLPEEVLELLERGALTEGHGRALLLAEDHDDRRRLGRSARTEGWSVRVTEQRAREANVKAPASSSARRRAHPDQQHAAGMIADRLGAALGAEVRVSPARGGYRAELFFASPEEAERLAARLNPRPR
ncbi:MAG TPA: ParB/RepB/Spo0J family partition protein [Solirubrobacteraceae bacterium]|nr:ParB/RepB/Spo0J family partition protein [Solirubrobacteraceae bacterium]